MKTKSKKYLSVLLAAILTLSICLMPTQQADAASAYYARKVIKNNATLYYATSSTSKTYKPYMTLEKGHYVKVDTSKPAKSGYYRCYYMNPGKVGSIFKATAYLDDKQVYTFIKKSNITQNNVKITNYTYCGTTRIHRYSAFKRVKANTYLYGEVYGSRSKYRRIKAGEYVKTYGSVGKDGYIKCYLADGSHNKIYTPSYYNGNKRTLYIKYSCLDNSTKMTKDLEPWKRTYKLYTSQFAKVKKVTGYVYGKYSSGKNKGKYYTQYYVNGVSQTSKKTLW